MPDAVSYAEAQAITRRLVDVEFAVQCKMWDEENGRADSAKGELMSGAMTALDLIALKRAGLASSTAVKIAAADFYPENWSGFRDYGSDVANLVVANAFILSEITRLVALGADRTRLSRAPDQKYNPETGLPIVSSDEAIEQVRSAEQFGRA